MLLEGWLLRRLQKRDLIEMQSNHNTKELPTYGEVLLDIDQRIKPTWKFLVLLCACQKIAKANDLTLKQQLHTWRPMDV